MDWILGVDLLKSTLPLFFCMEFCSGGRKESVCEEVLEDPGSYQQHVWVCVREREGGRGRRRERKKKRMMTAILG